MLALNFAADFLLGCSLMLCVVSGRGGGVLIIMLAFETRKTGENAFFHTVVLNSVAPVVRSVAHGEGGGVGKVEIETACWLLYGGAVTPSARCTRLYLLKRIMTNIFFGRCRGSGHLGSI